MSQVQAENTIQKAIQEAQEWPVKGWKMEFGPKRIPVNNLEEANKLSNKFVYRQEALAYWERVAYTSEDVVQWGKKALEALKKGDIKEAKDCLYFAVIIEKPLNDKAPTWSPALHSLN
jgi:hypothetical protein